MESISGGTIAHRHTWVRETDPDLFGRAFSRRLDDIHDEGGTIVHVSTQAMVFEDGLLHVGQVVYRALTIAGVGAVEAPTATEEPMTLMEEQVAEIVEELQ